ncbi:hypothetical protein [Candidatus Sodalis sp. SoCistrobi]|uniref:hypothetical protein n=1 Tax=Candidatus Sodalis sp. SoCistrobi TaxID=1922216 RepID=UPI00093A6C26|nr:hypothetical protein [Candidatus Sodalis sp. SoCistrobi]
MDRHGLAALMALAVAFGAGWQVSTWRHDSLAHAVAAASTQAAERARQAMEAVASESARELEEKLDALQQAQPKEIRTEVVKPVFTRVCVSDEFVRLYNRASADAERTLSGRTAGEMPGNITPP